LLVAARTADACSLAVLGTHTVDAAAQLSDHQAPTMGAETNARVNRSEGEQAGCAFTSQQVSSCGDLGAILITIAASDDQTPPAQLGYRLRVTAGTPPQGLVIPAEDVRALSAGLLPLHWSDKNPDSAFSFTLAISPIDAAGNVGAAMSLVIGDAGNSGCAYAPSARRSGSLPAAVALAFALLALRRRRRAQS
jgi:hypothetical protein